MKTYSDARGSDFEMGDLKGVTAMDNISASEGNPPSQ